MTRPLDGCSDVRGVRLVALATAIYAAAAGAIARIGPLPAVSDAALASVASLVNRKPSLIKDWYMHPAKVELVASRPDYSANASRL